ncbi:MAG TPA: pepsin/retropepsin-like aspartic protease family protein [Allosphingosinicella sp.]|nr:pepsin/retropepsin-like aspartic protease family protein [Allosphingosinicella sp.]
MRIRSTLAARSALAAALAWTPVPGILAMFGLSWLTPLPAEAQPTAQAAPAPARPADPLDALFEAAGRGETAGLERALADPATGRDRRALLRAALAASRLDPAAAREPALRRLAAGRDPALRRAALRIMTSSAFATGDYAEAARAGRLLAEALSAAGDAHGAEATARTWRLAALLAPHGRSRVAGPVRPGSIVARRDRVGLTRVTFSVNGQPQVAVFDTGAALSVLSASTAARLGVRIEEGATAIGNGVQGNVQTRIGVAPRVEIAGNVLTNVAFLILDDASLNFPQVPGGYDIPAIIGMPEMRALGRIRMEQAGRFTVLPPAAPGEGEEGAANLHAAGNQLFADVSIGGRTVPLLLDTGADRTSLTALYAESEPARIAALRTGQANAASAGGTRVQRFAIWPDAPVALDGRSLTLPQLNIELPGSGPEPDDNGTLGSDVLRRFESYTLDFRAMRLRLGAPVEAGSGQ